MADHPTKDELSGFVLGTLAPESTDVVADHLERCPPCQETVCELDSHKDTLLNGLRKPVPPVDEACRKLIDKVKAIPAEKPAEPSLTSNHASLPSASLPTATPGPSREQFLATLRASGVIDADHLSTLEKLPAVAKAADGAALARALVQNGMLTKFQATALYQGKTKGLVFGEYLVLDLLGAGGMGQVFKARHRSMDRIVALKVLSKAAVNSPDAVKRFQREAKAAAKLIHPNIVTAFDAGQQDGTHFLVMEYIEGSDLSALVKRDGPLPVDKVVSYIMQAARGLAFAHGKGVVHRDIKPGNLLVDHEGTVRILDMGLARIDGDFASHAAGEGLTQTGQVMGTVDYMAPEQAFDTSKADAKADMYSLGCTLYRLLIGQNMFTGDTLVQKILAHREKPIPSLLPSCPNVTPQLDAIYQRMVAKKPDDRPTMAELVTELETLGKGEPTTAFADSKLTAFFAAEQKPSAIVKSRPQTSANRTKHGGNQKPPSRKLIAAAAAGFLFVCLGIWVIVRDKDGNEVGRMQVPDGGSATVTSDVTSAISQRQPPAAMPTVSNTAKSTAPDSSGTPSPRYQNSLGMEFVLVPKGKAWLGGGGGKPGDTEAEFKNAFYLGVYEVTQNEWQKVTGVNPSFYSRTGERKDKVKDITDDDLKRFPVENVSWDNTQVFLKRLNDEAKESGWLYRLPTEAEWEYACRGGPMNDDLASAFSYYFDKPTNTLDANFANSKAGGRESVCKVGSYKPNSLGLYDMHGNVLEWCQGPEEGNNQTTDRMFVGGGCLSYAFSNCEVKNRYVAPRKWQSPELGLRVARVRIGTAPLASLPVTEKKPTPPSAGPQPSPTTPPSVALSADPDRRAAEWMLSKGMGVAIRNAAGDEGCPHRLSDLPKEPFALTWAYLTSNDKPVTDAELANFKNCKSVKKLILNSPQVTDVGLANFKDNSNLQSLLLSGARQVTDAGLAHFKECRNLTVVNLQNTKVTDAGLKYLENWKNLTDLNLISLPVSDAGLVHLKNCPALKYLGLTSVGKITDDGLLNLKPLKNLERLDLLGSEVGDAGLVHLKDLKNLTYLLLNAQRVTDAGLEHLAGLSKLTELELAKTKVSEAGVKKLSTALPLCKIKWDGGVIEPK